MKKEENQAHTGIRCGERLKITITDGDYTLREGIDYTTHYCRGTSEMAWLTVVVGIGKYENIFSEDTRIAYHRTEHPRGRRRTRNRSANTFVPK
ncbi:MAG: hypothetical protein K2N29_02025 [Ruminiclostridium sp.]|nr:hypothetical protein [Ruminiclostridium sp.]